MEKKHTMLDWPSLNDKQREALLQRTARRLRRWRKKQVRRISRQIAMIREAQTRKNPSNQTEQ
ncbi:MAG: hypothetical protein RMK52_01735 [Chitinophagales bacterium]|nr:hypothetical protein [Chitinophagales bacterium]MDW8392945.1 hypothetical protein [Chitinophagales bacterium]